MCYLFFFFKQKTAYDMRISDWSSDVCSSDLRPSPCGWSASVRDRWPDSMWRTPWRAPSALRGGGRAVAPSKPLPRRLSSAVILRRDVRGLRTQRRPGRGYTPDVLFTPQACTCTTEDPRNTGRELTLTTPPPP